MANLYLITGFILVVFGAIAGASARTVDPVRLNGVPEEAKEADTAADSTAQRSYFNEMLLEVMKQNVISKIITTSSTLAPTECD